jgi:hypothetical protein
MMNWCVSATPYKRKPIEMNVGKELVRRLKRVNQMIESDNPKTWTWVEYFKPKTIIYAIKNSQCLHDNCSMCDGAGIRKDGLGACIHMMSCSCQKCSPT